MMNIYDWIDTQIDTIVNCVGCLKEHKENIDRVIVQLWALKKHIDATIDFLERKKRFQ